MASGAIFCSVIGVLHIMNDSLLYSTCFVELFAFAMYILLFVECLSKLPINS
jgi:hypothetical protein